MYHKRGFMDGAIYDGPVYSGYAYRDPQKELSKTLQNTYFYEIQFLDNDILPIIISFTLFDNKCKNKWQWSLYKNSQYLNYVVESKFNHTTLRKPTLELYWYNFSVKNVDIIEDFVGYYPKLKCSWCKYSWCGEDHDNEQEWWDCKYKNREWWFKRVREKDAPQDYNFLEDQELNKICHIIK
eukprot:UN28486